MDRSVRADLRYGTLPGLVRGAAARSPAGIAVVDPDGRSWSFAELAAAVDEVARGLMAIGVEAGGRVGILAANGSRWIVAACAVHAVGGVLVPINTRYRPAETLDVLARSGAVAVFAAAEVAGNALLAPLVAGGFGGVIVSMDGAMDGEAAGALAWEDLLARGAGVPAEAVAARTAAVRPEDPSDVLYTSGTTGRSKGVVATHAQTLRTFGDWAAIVGLRSDDRYLVVPPFFHCFGYKAGWVACLIAGATCLPEPVFDAARVAARVGPDHVTVVTGPPALYQSLLDHPAAATLRGGSLRLAVTGAAVVPVELLARMRDELGFETVLTAYGLTESSGVATMCRQGDPLEVVSATSGRAIPDVEVRVVGADGAPVSPGEPGEVQVRGYVVTPGYLDDPEATAAATTADGWLRTGDVGVLDAAGYLRITDRLKDMFIVGGFNAYPAEIEAVLRGHPLVADVAVVGQADDRLGEVGCAFVVPRRAPGDAAPDLDALGPWCRERMANFKVPRRFVGVESLPRNASGKVLKTVLRERACSAG